MLDLFGYYLDLGEDAGGSVTLFKDFAISQRDGADIGSLAGMRIAGDLSQRTYWEELKRRSLLSDDFDPEREIDLLELEFVESQPSISEDGDTDGNSIGDETGSADGHTHILQADGVTNTVDGHNHRWEPTGDTTSEENEHFHTLKGIPDAKRSQGQQDESTAPAGTGEESDAKSGGGVTSGKAESGSGSAGS